MGRSKQKNDSSNPVVPVDQTQTIKILEDQLLKLGKFATQLKQMVQERDQEILRLKGILEKSTPGNGEVTPLFITDEEEISLQQLDRLKRLSQERPLTLEEIKSFDLLVKNKRLAQKQPTMIPYSPEKKKELPVNELVLIAETTTLLDEELGNNEN